MLLSRIIHTKLKLAHSVIMQILFSDVLLVVIAIIAPPVSAVRDLADGHPGFQWTREAAIEADAVSPSLTGHDDRVLWTTVSIHPPDLAGM